MQNIFHDQDLSASSFLVTGGAGFIGSHIAEYLLKNGAGKVRVLDNMTNGFELTPDLANDYEAVIVTVPHRAFANMDAAAFVKITKPHAIIADLKGAYRGIITSRKYWSL